MDIRVSIKEQKIPMATHYEVTAGCTTLFEFSRSVWGTGWVFRTWGGRRLASFEGEEFPMEYFENLCRATYFVEFGIDEFPERVYIHSGKKYLNIK